MRDVESSDVPMRYFIPTTLITAKSLQWACSVDIAKVCYYAARLATAEALMRMRRQAAAILWREVYTGFTTPTGVWWVRENVRAMFKDEPARFDTLEEALEAASYLLKIPMERWLTMSRIVHLLKNRLV